MNENFDAARLTLLLSELRLPATKQIWASFAEQSVLCPSHSGGCGRLMSQVHFEYR